VERVIDRHFLCPCGLCRDWEGRTEPEAGMVRLIPRIAKRGADCVGGDLPRYGDTGSAGKVVGLPRDPLNRLSF
jgi:hypothetical protein